MWPPRSLDPDKGHELFAVYKDRLLRVFRKNKGHTPTPSHHPSAPSPLMHKQRDSAHCWRKRPAIIEGQMNKYVKILLQFLASISNPGSAARRLPRCFLVFSGKLDNDSIEANLVPEDGPFVTVTELAHIFNRSTNEGLEDSKKASYAASALAVLSQFGKIDACVYRLENVLTLAPDIHKLFDDLQLWLERNPTALPPPDPCYLALHVACARVAHLSDAGEYIDRILRDIEKIGVLANDAASDTLHHARVRCLDVEDRAY